MKHNLLLVEDDLISRLAMEQHLKRSGDFQIYLAKNASEVYEIVTQITIDIILIDIRLGDDDGIDVVNQLQPTMPLVPIIYVTASTDPKTFNRALQTNPYHIINKPVDLNQLSNAVVLTLKRVETQSQKDSFNANEMIGLIYDTARIGMCVTDKKGTFVKVNKAYCQTYKYTQSHLIGKNFTIVVPADMKQYAQKMHDDFILQNITELPGEWQVMCSDGQIKDVFVTAGRFMDEHGEPYKVTTVTDITARKEYTKRLEDTIYQRDLLLKEVYHRVKNNLNLVSSIFHLQMTKEDDSKANEVLKSGIGRMKSLALLHEKLYKHDINKIDLRDYLMTVAHGAAGLIQDDSVSIEINIPRLECKIDTAVALGLITNELVTNTSKHAFKDHQSTTGKKYVSVIMNSIDDSRYELLVRDNGEAVNDDVNLLELNSVGLQLVKALSEQVNGNLSFNQNNEYKEFIVDFSCKSISQSILV